MISKIKKHTQTKENLIGYQGGDIFTLRRIISH